MLELLLVAVAVGLGNFAAAIGIGISEHDPRARLRVGLTFGLFEGAMPLVGLLLGRRFAGPLGSKAALVGGALLIATGIYGFVQARRQHDDAAAAAPLRLRRLLLIAAALSVDNLIVGLALGTSQVSLLGAVVTIAVVSVLMSMAGLELGSRLGARFERWAGEIGAAVLVLVGALIAAGVF